MSAPPLEVAPRADEYDGAARLSTGELRIEVRVTLRSVFEPIDGHLHWYGRIATNQTLTDSCTSGTSVALTIGTSSATGRITDVDPWGRFRISGTGRPPF
ncbi:DUF4873 domain-containing protein [Nocardioides jensenii]|uniref:DUF4873 domain-containing protein n=1 Tax=Nocardioides jensenii TaxID=1843 RepID=UPI00082DC158|nr:DUF4873 domain-containing protein [Nocardioides jensenii]